MQIMFQFVLLYYIYRLWFNYFSAASLMLRNISRLVAPHGIYRCMKKRVKILGR